MSKVFEGFTVLELASVLAGPAVGMFFAELGAKVIKVENVLSGGDVTRSWRLASEKDPANPSAYYCSVNYQKEVLQLNLKDEKDRSKVYELIQTADIVLSNFRVPVAAKLGFDYASVKGIKADVIFAELGGYPESDRPAYDVVLQAETGFMYMTGEKGRRPVKMPVALIDILAAHQLKEGILIALLQKMKTGKGAHVQVNLFDSALASLANQATNWLIAGHIPQAIGSEHPNIAPYGDVFEGRDGRLFVLAVGSDKHFQSLCELTGLNELWKDERFNNNASRVVNRSALVAMLTEAFRSKPAVEWLKLMEEKAVPSGLIRNMQEIFELPEARKNLLHFSNDPQLPVVATVAFDIR